MGVEVGEVGTGAVLCTVAPLALRRFPEDNSHGLLLEGAGCVCASQVPRDRAMQGFVGGIDTGVGAQRGGNRSRTRSTREWNLG